MKWFRNFYFYKRWINIENDYYRIVNDANITSFVLEKAKYYNLKIVKLQLNDYNGCYIQFWGDKASYLCFVRDFVNTYKEHIRNISF